MKSENKIKQDFKEIIKDILENGTELKTRDDKSQFNVFGSVIDRNKKYKDILYDLDFQIDNYAYEFFNDSLNSICDVINFEDFRNIEELIEYLENYKYYEQCEADIYTTDLLQWVSSNLQNQSYCDEVLMEFNPKEFTTLLQMGQQRHKEEIFSLTIRFLIEVLENLQED